MRHTPACWSRLSFDLTKRPATRRCIGGRFSMTLRVHYSLFRTAEAAHRQCRSILILRGRRGRLTAARHKPHLDAAEFGQRITIFDCLAGAFRGSWYRGRAAEVWLKVDT